MSRHRAEPEPEVTPEVAARTERAHAVLAHAMASSVEPIEAAVVLESGGVNDRVARDTFLVPDVLDLAEIAIAEAGPDGPVSEPVRARPETVELAVPAAGVWFHLRGVLYAVPALVTLTLLPAVDPVESALVLGALVLSWAWCYGVASIAWAHLGNRDPAGARRFLRRALLGGALLAGAVAVLAVYAALMLTDTMQVTLVTVVLLAGQGTYLLAAATLLMTRREPLLLVALVPALVALGLELAGRPPTNVLGWVGGSVVLAAVFALGATRGAARPHQRLGAAAWGTALQQLLLGLLVAVVVLFPAVNELVDDNYAALPLSVTLAALPLVLSLGIGESLLQRFRARTAELLATTSSSAAFARAARRAVLAHHLAFVLPLVTMSALLDVVVTHVAGPVGRQYGLLAIAYVLLGTAVFAAMLLTIMGRTGRVLGTLTTAVLALAVVEVRAAADPISDSAALACLVVVTAAVLVVHLLLVVRYAADPVSHR